jgi:hypothetical protein
MDELTQIPFNEDAFLEKYGVKLSELLDRYTLYNPETDTNAFNDIIDRLDTLTAAEDLYAKLDTLQAGVNNIFQLIALILAVVVIAFVFKILYSFLSGIIRG